MEIVYLKNGEKCEFIEKINNRYLVSKFMYYYDYEGNESEESGNESIIVDQIFKKAPIGVKSDELISILSKIESKSKTLRDLEIEIKDANLRIDNIKYKESDLKKWQIDLSKFRDAKRMVFFAERSGELIVTEPDYYKNKGREIKFGLNVYSGEINHYFTEIDYDGGRGYGSTSIDIDFGILIDPTDGEIINFVKKRFELIISDQCDWPDWAKNYIYKIPKKYWPEELTNSNKEKEQQSMKNNISDLERRLSEKKEELKKKKEELRLFSK